MRTLVLLYGLPGSGKSSLAMELANFGFHYTNLSLCPDFGNRPMADLVIENYLKSPSDVGLVVEGVFPKRRFRTNMVNQIICSPRLLFDGGFSRVATFYLNCPSSILATRRKRSVEEYNVLLKGLEIYNPPFYHAVLDCAVLNKTAIQLAREVLYCLLSMNVCEFKN